MAQNDLERMRTDVMIKSIERQRNEALSREVQKDAVIALLQAQNGSLIEKLKATETRIAEMETAAQRKKPKAA